MSLEQPNYYNLQPPLGTSVNWNNPLTNQLGAWWPFNEGAGLLIKDIVGKNSGTLKNASSSNWRPGPYGNNLFFDNVDDIVDCGNRDDILMANKPCTITAWIYFTSTGGNDAGRIIGKETPTTTNGLRFYLSNFTGIFSLQFTITGAVDLDIVMVHGFLKSDSWNHCAVTYDGGVGSGGARIYLNGVERGYKATTQSGRGLIDNSGDTILIGNRGNLTRSFAGNITNIKVWNRALSQGEVIQDYNSPWGMMMPQLFPSMQATDLYGIYEQKDYSNINVDSASSVDWDNSLSRGLLAYWPFNEGSGGVLNDIAGNHNGNIIGSAINWNNRIGKVSGKYFAFNGVDNYFDCGNRSDVLNSGKMTISAWINPRSIGSGTSSYIIGKGTDAGAASQISFRVTSNSTLTFSVVGSPANVSITGVDNSIIFNSWQHVILTWDGLVNASSVHIYVNGNEIGYQTLQNGQGLAGTSFQKLTVGGRVDLTRSFDGGISNLKVWNRVLNYNEIVKDYLSPWSMIKPNTIFLPLIFSSSPTPPPPAVGGRYVDASHLLGMAGSFI